MEREIQKKFFNIELNNNVIIKVKANYAQVNSCA